MNENSGKLFFLFLENEIVPPHLHLNLTSISNKSKIHSLQANQLFLKRSGNPLGGAAAQSSADKCDGQDELGCYQVSHFHEFYLIFFVNYGRCNFGL